MTQLDTQHWHVEMTFPGHRKAYENDSFNDIESAVGYADQARDNLRQSGHQVTEVDRPDDDVAGVVQRYRARSKRGDTAAIIEVRPCYQERCLPDPALRHPVVPQTAGRR
jgi:hypothetical protein